MLFDVVHHRHSFSAFVRFSPKNQVIITEKSADCLLIVEIFSYLNKPQTREVKAITNDSNITNFKKIIAIINRIKWFLRKAIAYYFKLSEVEKMRGCFVKLVVSNQFSKNLGHRECSDSHIMNILNAPKVVLYSHWQEEKNINSVM